MCGIAGFWSADARRDPAPVARGMADALTHRGPDAGGAWGDPARGVGLGHRRLSILDLSPLGRQPMESPSGRYVIAFNGEVFNFAALKGELQAAGSSFVGDSDTEVMLHAIEAWGLEPAVKRFVGMFAFALWDRADRALHLVRDRIGIKPLFYGWSGDTLLFGSELKALRAFPGFGAQVDPAAVAAMLRYGYVPAPATVYRGVHKLLPGTVLTLRSPRDRPAPQAYWSAREVAERGMANPFRGTPDEAVERLDGLLRDAVALRMVADVPLGAFLSGGIDSSTVVALMQAQSPRPVKTFSIGFHEREYNEAGHAAAVAAHLGTDHTELFVTAREAMDVIPSLPEMFDEPFADPSQIPTYLVSKLARGSVTVSLSGDGGDELFGGYNRHLWARGIGAAMGRVPPVVRAGAARALRSVSAARWDQAFALAGPVLPKRLRQQTPGYKLHKLAEVLGERTPDGLYRRIVSQWSDPAQVVPGVAEAEPALARAGAVPAFSGLAERMMFLDLVTYLPDGVLTKVDRASMAVSLEARVPLLDHRVAEFAWTLPLDYKVRGGVGKWPLRQVLARYVPPRLFERPKSGFSVPLEGWLRGPLRDWAEDLLSPARLSQDGIFDPAPVRARWHEHLSGARDWQYPLWNVLMFQAWRAREPRGADAREAA
jgi:asparagine synthase (glutamine-hydrolysing)